MTAFTRLLRDYPNYRRLWLGQVISEVGDHFNTVAVLSLTLQLTGSGLAVGGAIIARMLPMILAAPWAGVLLDQRDRRRIMIASDLLRAVLALCFLLIPLFPRLWLIYLLSGALMFASPFFTSGRSAILPAIAEGPALHTANALTQTTSWLTLSIGTFLGGVTAMQFGYQWAFVLNAASFLVSALAVARMQAPPGTFRAIPATAVRPPFWQEYVAGWQYIRRTPLVLAILLAWVGWATGGGAAQMLFTMFGEVVFHAGPAGLGTVWGSAGVGLVMGGLLGHRLGAQLSFRAYKHAIPWLMLLHGLAYTLFSISPTILIASCCVALSRIGMGAMNVLNRTALLEHVPAELRGRVFTTVDMASNATMMVSLALAGAAVGRMPIRTVGVIAGLLSSTSVIGWVLADRLGRLPEPARQAVVAAFDEQVT